MPTDSSINCNEFLGSEYAFNMEYTTNDPNVPPEKVVKHVAGQPGSAAPGANLARWLMVLLMHFFEVPQKGIEFLALRIMAYRMHEVSEQTEKLCKMDPDERNLSGTKKVLKMAIRGPPHSVSDCFTESYLRGHNPAFKSAGFQLPEKKDIAWINAKDESEQTQKMIKAVCDPKGKYVHNLKEFMNCDILPHDAIILMALIFTMEGKKLRPGQALPKGCLKNVINAPNRLYDSKDPQANNFSPVSVQQLKESRRVLGAIFGELQKIWGYTNPSNNFSRPRQVEVELPTPDSGGASGGEANSGGASGGEANSADASGGEADSADASGGEANGADASGGEADSADAMDVEPSGGEPSGGEASGGEATNGGASGGGAYKHGADPLAISVDGPPVKRIRVTEALVPSGGDSEPQLFICKRAFDTLCEIMLGNKKATSIPFIGCKLQFVHAADVVVKNNVDRIFVVLCKYILRVIDAAISGEPLDFEGIEEVTETDLRAIAQDEVAGDDFGQRVANWINSESTTPIDRRQMVLTAKDLCDFAEWSGDDSSAVLDDLVQDAFTGNAALARVAKLAHDLCQCPLYTKVNAQDVDRWPFVPRMAYNLLQSLANMHSDQPGV